MNKQATWLLSFVTAGIALLAVTESFAAIGGTAVDVRDYKSGNYNRIAHAPGELACNMALITPTIGITAAHCVENLAGIPEDQLSRNAPALVTVPEDPDSQFMPAADYIPVKRVILHPRYRPSGKITFVAPLGPFGQIFPYDLALVQLARQSKYPVIGPEINLPSQPMEKEEALRVFSNGSDGAQLPRELDVKAKGKAFRARTVAKIVPNNKNDFICPGDSGGPVFRPKADGSVELAALVSGGILNKPSFMLSGVGPIKVPNCEKDFIRTIFVTDIYAHLEWITQTIAELEQTNSGNP